MGNVTALFVGFMLGVCFATVLVWQALKDKDVSE